MDLDLLRRVRRTAAVFGVVLAIPFAAYWGIGSGAAWTAGILWSLVNLHFVTSVVRGLFTAERRERLRLIILLLVKFPVLYAIGYLFLRSEQLPAAWIVAGFTWPFFVIVMKALGRTFMHMDERNAAGASQP